MALPPGKLAMLTDAVAATASWSCGGIGPAPNAQSENRMQSLVLGNKAAITIKMARNFATRASA
jgi:hypothetical protein